MIENNFFENVDSISAMKDDLSVFLNKEKEERNKIRKRSQSLVDLLKMAEKISDGFKYVYILKNKKTFFLRRPLCYLFELGQPELYAWDGAIKYDSYAKIYENLIYCSSPKEPFKENLLDDNKYEALYKDLCKAIKNKNFLKEDYSSDYD